MDLNPCQHVILTVRMVNTEMTVFLLSLSFLQCSDDEVKMSFTSPRTITVCSNSAPMSYL